MRLSRHDLLAALLALGLAAGAPACSSESAAERAEGAASAQETKSARAELAHAGKAFHRAAGDGPAYRGPGDLYTFLATGDETNGAYFQFEALVPPGGGPPPHIHGGEDESFYLAQGSLEMRLGDATVAAKSGDFVNVPRGTIHGFKNVGKETAKMVVTFVPAGFEKYFEEVFPLATDRTAAPPPVTDEFIQRMIAAAPKHRCEILPPPSPVK